MERQRQSGIRGAQGARGDTASPPPSTLPWLCSIPRAFTSWLPGVRGERGLEHSTDQGAPSQGAPGAKQGHSPSSRSGRDQQTNKLVFLICFFHFARTRRETKGLESSFRTGPCQISLEYPQISLGPYRCVTVSSAKARGLVEHWRYLLDAQLRLQQTKAFGNREE